MDRKRLPLCCKVERRKSILHMVHSVLVLEKKKQQTINVSKKKRLFIEKLDLNMVIITDTKHNIHRPTSLSILLQD